MGMTPSALAEAEASAAPTRRLSERFGATALVELVVGIHEAGRCVRDPSPTVLSADACGRPTVVDSDLEARSDGAVPILGLHELWALMEGEGVRERLEAGRAYLERRGLEADLEAALRNHRRRQAERCFGDNRDFKPLQAGGLVWHVRRKLVRDSHLPVLSNPDRFLGSDSRLLKNGASTTLSIAPGDAILKRFNLKRYRSLLKNQFQRSRARKAFQGAYHLEIFGIPTARPIAFAEKKLMGLVTKSYLLMEFIPDTRAVDQFTREWNVEDEAARRATASLLGRILGRLHESGFANRDLKPRNVIVGQAGDAWIIDLDGVHFKERVNDETRFRNLDRMVREMREQGSLSVRDRMRFLRSYVQTAGAGSAGTLFRRLADAERR